MMNKTEQPSLQLLSFSIPFEGVKNVNVGLISFSKMFLIDFGDITEVVTNFVS